MQMFAIIGRGKVAIFLWAYLAFLLLMCAIGYYNGRSGFLTNIIPSSSVGRYFYDLRRATINVGGSFTTARGTIRMAVSLEIDEKDAKLIGGYAPRIMDQLQNFMSEVRIDDVRRAAGLEWLRRELLWEANKASGPVRILNVSFREFFLTQ